MIGKIISQLLGGGGGECEDRRGELLDFEEGGWVIVNLPEVGPLLSPEASETLGELLLEQPSMSVLQMRCRMSAADLHDEDEDESSNENEEDLSSRPLALRPASLAFRRSRVSWRLAAWGLPLPAHAVPPPAERKRLSRGALLRRNLATVKTRQRRVGAHVKQPGPRPHNY
uniref:Uncharacterized protein n=1 Tax=Hippocampus comes TaxID=109280 RepID=A0A3Q2Y4V9_HIPCM